MGSQLIKLNSQDNAKLHRKQFLDLCKNYTNLDIPILKKAFFYCFFFHKDDIRKDGTRYYLHPLHSAIYLIDIFKFYDTDTIVACLLHDAVEESKNENIKKYRQEKIAEVFGKDVLELVLQVTKIKSSRYVESETFRTLTLSMIRDIRVILVKMSDRLHNLETLKGHKIKKRREIAEETLKFFVPIAQWLGIRNVKQYIEEICFENLNKKTFKKIQNYRENQRKIFTNYIKELEVNLQSKLNNHNIKNNITVEHKTSYEIYELAKREGINYREVDNFYSMVITICKNKYRRNDEPFINCYTAYGVLNKYFTVIDERDYIRNPKFNNFQSIITYIYNEKGKKVEILIRTEEMDNIAMHGTLDTIKNKKKYRTLNLSDYEIELLSDYIDELIEAKGEKAKDTIWDLMGINFYREEINVYANSKKYKLPKDTALINLAFIFDPQKAFYIDFKKTTIYNNKSKRKRDAYYNTMLKDSDQIEFKYTNRITAQDDWRNHLTLFGPIVKYYEYEKKKKKNSLKIF